MCVCGEGDNVYEERKFSAFLRYKVEAVLYRV